MTRKASASRVWLANIYRHRAQPVRMNARTVCPESMEEQTLFRHAPYVHQASTTRQKPQLLAHCVPRIRCLILVLMQRRIANATKALVERTDKPAPHAKLARTQTRLATPYVPTVVLGTTPLALPTPCAKSALQAPLQQQKRPVPAFAMQATLVSPAQTVVRVLQAKPQICRA